MKILITRKEIEEDIDLDTEIEIPKIDLITDTIEEMRLTSQLLEKKARQKKLRSERDKEYRIIESAKNIITKSIGVEVDSTQHILIQLEEVVKKINEDSFGQEKLIEKVERKFDNNVVGHIVSKLQSNKLSYQHFWVILKILLLIQHHFL